jgi:hypothetical protein
MAGTASIVKNTTTNAVADNDIGSSVLISGGVADFSAQE